MTCYTKASLQWLELILVERFGLSIKLLHSENQLKLILTDVDGSGVLIFPHLIPDFHEPKAKLPCCLFEIKESFSNFVLTSNLVMPGVSNFTGCLVLDDGEALVINYDILGLVYWMLNRIEEIDAGNLDEHGRFAATNSHAYTFNYLNRPIVDEWLSFLKALLERKFPELAFINHKFSIAVSHDVDAPSKYGFKQPIKLLRSMAATLFKEKKLKEVILSPLINFKTRKQLSSLDPYNTFDWLMDVSEKFNLKSAFYFISGRTEVSRDADYEIEHPAIKKLIRSIIQRGHEVGLHPSYNTYLNPLRLKTEAERLKRVLNVELNNGIGGRMHYLRWKHPETLQSWNDAGMEYDSTLGYADMPGFRCGTCYEYTAFNPTTQKILDLRIRPLIAMECTVIDERYMGLGHTDTALNTFLELKYKCEQVNGIFSLLWHNSNFTDEKDKLMYISILSKDN